MKKYHYYVDPGSHTLSPAEPALGVQGDSKVESIIFVFPGDFGLDLSAAVIRVYYDPPGRPARSEVPYETLGPVAAGPQGIKTAEWTLEHVHSVKSGRVNFTLAVLADGAVRWISRKAWVPILESYYSTDSPAQEAPYTSRLEAAETAIASILDDNASLIDELGEEFTAVWDALTVDDTPTMGSAHLVTSGGVAAAIAAAGEASAGMINAAVSLVRQEVSTLREDVTADWLDNGETLGIAVLKSKDIAANLSALMSGTAEAGAAEVLDDIRYIIRTGADHLAATGGVDILASAGTVDEIRLTGIARIVLVGDRMQLFGWQEGGWVNLNQASAATYLRNHSFTIYGTMPWEEGEGE